MQILVIEDEKSIAGVIESGLSQQGFNVTLCHNGKDGLELALSGNFDLLVLDIMLPDLDGISILRQLRKQGSALCVILLTARDSIEDRVEGLERGADDYLTKPFYVEELVARVRALYRRKTESASSILKFGGVTLDRTSRNVFVGDKKLNLTTREFCVLELLMRTPGNVYTRTELLDKVWDLQFDPSTNIVDVYMRRLRAKLADAGVHGIIETVRGVGYRTTGNTGSSE